MLDNIINLVKEQVTSVISGNADIPADKKSEAVSATTTSIVDGLKSQFTSDNLSSITSLFSGGDNSSSGIVDSLQTSVVSTLSEKVGLSKDVASGIASSIIPAVVGLFSQGGGAGFSVDSLIGAFTGGDGGGDPKKSGGGLLGTLGRLFGKK